MVQSKKRKIETLEEMAEIIDKEIKLNNLTYYQIAERCKMENVKYSHVQRIATGKNFTIKSLLPILKVLGLHIKISNDRE